MTCQEALEYLSTLENYELRRSPCAMRAIRLERMQRLCRRLGDPQRRFRAVVVAGTNGKGSISALLYSMLRESALRVGLYTSPHLEHVRERIRVWDGAGAGGERRYGDDWISERELAGTVEALRPALEASRLGALADRPTYFEALTALTFLYFSRRQVEVAVLEVGMGGRLDATNVVEQAVSVFGPVGIDHAEILGPDPASIAREKAGIIKPGQTVITVPQAPEVAEVLREACAAQSVPLMTVGEHLTVEIQRHSLEGLELSLTGLRGIYECVEVTLLGRHQAGNAAAAVGALEALSLRGAPHTLVERGLAEAQWPGRIELISEAPLVLLDGAHNAQAAQALADTLRELCAGAEIHLMVGMSADKSVEDVARILGGLARSVTCTRSRHPRAMDPMELAKRFAPFCRDVHVMSDPADAYTYLHNAVSSRDVIVATGSLFLAGELRGALRQSRMRTTRPLAAAQ